MYQPIASRDRLLLGRELTIFRVAIDSKLSLRVSTFPPVRTLQNGRATAALKPHRNGDDLLHSIRIRFLIETRRSPFGVDYILWERNTCASPDHGNKP